MSRSFDRRQRFPKRSQRGALWASLDQHSYHRQNAIGAAMDQMQLRRRWLSAYRVLAGRVKMKLDQLVSDSIYHDRAARIVVHLNRVPIVQDGDSGLLVSDLQTGQSSGRGSPDVKRGLGVTRHAAGKRGIERTPVCRTRLSLVSPMRGLMCLRRQGPGREGDGDENYAWY